MARRLISSGLSLRSSPGGRCRCFVCGARSIQRSVIENVTADKGNSRSLLARHHGVFLHPARLHSFRTIHADLRGGAIQRGVGDGDVGRGDIGLVGSFGIVDEAPAGAGTGVREGRLKTAGERGAAVVCELHHYLLPRKMMPRTSPSPPYGPPRSWRNAAASRPRTRT